MAANTMVKLCMLPSAAHVWDLKSLNSLVDKSSPVSGEQGHTIRINEGHWFAGLGKTRRRWYKRRRECLTVSSKDVNSSYKIRTMILT